MKSNLNLILAKLNFGIRTVVLYARTLNLESFEFDQTYWKYKQLLQKKRRLKERKTKYVHYIQFKNAAAIAEGHDYVTSKSDEGFTLPDSFLK